MEQDHRKRRLGSPVPSSGSAAQKRKLSNLVNSSSSHGGRNGSSPAAAAAAAISGLVTPSTGAFEDDPDETEDENEEAEENALDAALGLENGFIERFRKGALHRQLLEARREHERTAKKAFKLQADLDTTRQRLSRTEASWLQLVDEIRAAVGYTGHSKPEGLVNGHSDHDSASQQAHEAKQLVAAFVTKLATGELNRDILRRCEVLSAELAESRAAYTLLESVLSQTREELNTATEALRLAQRKADRDRDATIAKLDARTHSAEASRRAQDKAEKEAAAQAAQAALAEQQQQRVSPGIVKSEKRSTSPTANAAAAVKADAHAADTSMKVDVADQQVGSSGLTSSEIQELQRLAQYRLDEMDTLRKDKTLLQLEVETMKRRTVNPQVDVIKSTSVYKALVADYERAKRDCDIANNALPVLKADAAALRSEQAQQRETIDSELAIQLEELTKKYAQTAHDLGRIRAERDTRLGELAEAHAAKDAKSKHTDQMRLLAENRQTRINVLASELQRLRMKLAANRGDKDTVDLISQHTADSKEPADNTTSANGTLPEEVVVRHLQEELRASNHLVQVMKQNLAVATGLSETSEDLDMAEQLMRDCAQANASAETASARLKQLEALLGGSESPDIATLAKSIDESTDTIKRLEANAAIADTTTNMLVAEVSRLSEAWDTLNKQNHDKIFELAGYEKKLEQYSIDKQKATQKYFASERDKEAILQQHKSLSVAKEQQAKVLEVQESTQRALHAQLASLKSEVAEHQSLLTEAEQKISEKTSMINKEAAAADSTRRELSALQVLYETRAKYVEAESASRAKAEEKVIKLETELEKAKKRAESASAAAAGKGRIPDLDLRELQTECQNLHTLLRCSSCKLRFKSHILLRCSHLLCKECIDARLDTRQRKCPTCQTPFGAADVQQVYMNA